MASSQANAGMKSEHLKKRSAVQQLMSFHDQLGPSPPRCPYSVESTEDLLRDLAEICGEAFVRDPEHYEPTSTLSPLGDITSDSVTPEPTQFYDTISIVSVPVSSENSNNAASAVLPTVSRKEPNAYRPISHPTSTQPKPSQSQHIPGSESPLLLNLASKYTSLSKALQEECDISKVPISLIQAACPVSEQLPIQIPLSARSGMLQASLLSLQHHHQVKASQLQKFYQIQSGRLEAERVSQLFKASQTPSVLPTINNYFDMQHYALIDNIELQIQYLHHALPIPDRTNELHYANVISNGTCPVPNHAIVVPNRVTADPNRNTAVPKHTSAVPNHINAVANNTNAVPHQTIVTPRVPVPFSPPITEKNTIISALNASIKNNEQQKKSKKPNPLNTLAIRIMNKWYERNKDRPYPSNDSAEVMAKAGNITTEQVKKWFANKRMRNANTKPQARRRKQPCSDLDFDITPPYKKLKM